MWIAQLRNGTTVLEGDCSWTVVAKEVVRLGIAWEGRLIELPLGMKCYFQGKTGSITIGSNEIEIESRWIGCETPAGNRLRLRFKEGTDPKLEFA